MHGLKSSESLVLLGQDVRLEPRSDFFARYEQKSCWEDNRLFHVASCCFTIEL